MKPLILTAMTVIGLFGIIGTVEYTHAQTIMTIPEPDNLAEAVYGTGEIFVNENWKAGYTNTGATNQPFIPLNYGEGSIGDITIKRNTEINNPLFENIKTNGTIKCAIVIEPITNLISRNHSIHNLVIPDNISPKTTNNVNAIGVDYYNNDDRESKCTPDFEAPSKHPLLTKQEIRINIYNQHDKKPYYISPRENILQAQPIPACTNNTITLSTQTLKGDTKMCYGKNGNDMIIITKKLSGFYGTAETITTPTIERNLDSNVVDTPEYLALLKRLYLPPI